MLAKCINPSCSASFHSLEEGRLFRLESDQTLGLYQEKAEYFWLCAGCSATTTVRLDETAKVKICPVPESVHRDSRGAEFIPLARRSGRLLSFFSAPPDAPHQGSPHADRSGHSAQRLTPRHRQGGREALLVAI
jgi:hypothetical protein